jgi:hypothetical protein
MDSPGYLTAEEEYMKREYIVRLTFAWFGTMRISLSLSSSRTRLVYSFSDIINRIYPLTALRAGSFSEIACIALYISFGVAFEFYNRFIISFRCPVKYESTHISFLVIIKLYIVFATNKQCENNYGTYSHYFCNLLPFMLFSLT